MSCLLTCLHHIISVEALHCSEVASNLSDLPNLPNQATHTTIGSTEVYANIALRPTRLLK